MSVAFAQKSVLPIESGKNSAASSQTQIFSFRTAITSMLSKEFQRQGVILLQERGITQLVTYNRVGGGGRSQWIPNNLRLRMGKAGRDEYQRASGKRVQLWKETVRLEVTPLSFGKWGLRHRKHRGAGRVQQ